MHAIETHGNLAAFVASRTPAWHDLGTVVDADLSVTEGMKIGHLDWDVRTEPLTVNVGGINGDPNMVSPIPATGYYATVRDNPFVPGVIDILGVGLTDAYSIIQNTEAAEFMEAILDSGDVVLDAAGSLHDGKKIFVTLRMPDSVTIAGTDDAVDQYLIGTWTHNGWGAMQVFGSSVRVVCQNTLTYALEARGKGAPTYKVRHTGSGIVGKIDQARRALDVTFTGNDEFMKVAAEWAAAEVTAKQFDTIVDRLAPEPKQGAGTRAANTATAVRDGFRTLYTDAPTQDGIRGTAWGALQAWGEYVEWFGGNYGKDDANRSLSRFDSVAIEEKRALGAKVIREVVFA